MFAQHVAQRVPRIPVRWAGEEVTEIDTTVGRLPLHLPAFARTSFGPHRLKDVILNASTAIPVGVVSKSYVLMQHHEVVDAIRHAVSGQRVEPDGLRAHLRITEYGTRMSLRVIMPQAFSRRFPDGHDMALTFECFNSVDGTVPLLALVGWFRFVCRNGLAVGAAVGRFCRRHSPARHPAEFPEVLAEGLAAARRDVETFAAWTEAAVTSGRVIRWVDGPVADAWGANAAARAYTIAQRGRDGEPQPVFRKMRPHERPVRLTTTVPGTTVPCPNRYAAAQALAWIAARRTDVREGLAWREQIPALVEQL